MVKNAAITVRLPLDLKRRLARRAKREHRSISAQVLYELELAVAREPNDPTEAVAAVGRFRGAALPSDEDFGLVRAMLWGRMGRPDG